MTPDQLRECPIDQCAENTDREIYRGPDDGCGDYYSDSLHITQEGALGIDCGGYVIVKPIRTWHGLSKAHAAALEEIERLKKENDTLRGLLGNSAKPCPYCGLPAEDQAKCPSGFPGCARADDQMLSKHFADAYRAEQAERRAERLQAKVDSLMLEYCPDEMTPEQLAEWEKHQRAVPAEFKGE